MLPPWPSESPPKECVQTVHHRACSYPTPRNAIGSDSRNDARCVLMAIGTGTGDPLPGPPVLSSGARCACQRLSQRNISKAAHPGTARAVMLGCGRETTLPAVNSKSTQEKRNLNLRGVKRKGY